ncbi:hypothetical protein BDV93DRAFT_449148 [Ceratobasidium sp. AG-I]|nr:hypothetical protein BDV93DRAFT_449148 [Ceratobasidium sp. AG-I]
MRTLRKQLSKLQEDVNRKARKKNLVIDLRDQTDIQALLDYSVLVSRLAGDGADAPETTASLQIARCKLSAVSAEGEAVSKGAWYARTLRKKARHVHDWGVLPERKQGKGATHSSLLDDSSVRKAVELYTASLRAGELTPLGLTKELNRNILPNLNTSKSQVSESTSKQWMIKLGYQHQIYRKGVYMDGHERVDVVEYRAQFLDELKDLLPQIQKYSEHSCDALPLILPSGKRRIIPVFHDECCFHSNDMKSDGWLKPGQSILRQKGRGRLVHVSDFVAEDTGRLYLTHEQIKVQEGLPSHLRLLGFDARKIIYPGKNHDPYWDMPQLIEQLAIQIFDITHPNCVMLMVFDQSSAHNAFAADALNARKMNVGPSGKQPSMHSTSIPANNPSAHLRGQYQAMSYDSTHPTAPNQPKGMEAVIKERGLWDQLVAATSKKKPVGRCKLCKANAAERDRVLADAQAALAQDPDAFSSIANIPSFDINNRFCCMEKCLATESDFQAEKPMLQLVVEAAGHKCILLPKFHCELNPIEMYWGYAKHKFRKDCNGSFLTAKQLVPKCLDACSIITIRRFFHKSWRYMESYRNGLTGVLAEQAEKKYTSHRKVSKRAMMQASGEAVLQSHMPPTEFDDQAPDNLGPEAPGGK